MQPGIPTSKLEFQAAAGQTDNDIFVLKNNFNSLIEIPGKHFNFCIRE